MNQWDFFNFICISDRYVPSSEICTRRAGTTRGLKLRQNRHSAVTFSELLLVVVITTLLSIFFIFSSRYLVIRSKVARVQEEQRVLQRALGNYQMDYSDVPRNEIGLRALNAPTTYLTSIPKDPFGGNGTDRTYFYYREPEAGFYYVVISAGPDGDIDFQDFLAEHNQVVSSGGHPAASHSDAETNGMAPPNDPTDVRVTYRDFQDFLIKKTYDPTNGINSDGDIFSYMRQ